MRFSFFYNIARCFLPQRTLREGTEITACLFFARDACNFDSVFLKNLSITSVANPRYQDIHHSFPNEKIFCFLCLNH